MKVIAWLSLLLLTFNILPAQSKNSKPLAVGVTDALVSATLNEKRTLNIYLPEGYNRSDTVHYPVIFLLDGSMDEDFLHVAGIVQFNTFSWVNRTPRSIVVGIATVDRRRDFTFPTQVAADRQRNTTSGHSAAFIRFIETELIPFISTNYKTTNHRTLVGQSLGGLVATEILFRKPALFSDYLIVSPSLWWNNGSLLSEQPVAVSTTTNVYIAVGKEGLTPSEPARVMEVDANLLAEKLRRLNNDRLTVHFDYLPAEDHATIGHQAILNGLNWLGARH